MRGPVSLHVTDAYNDGEARLDVRLLGLPLQRQRGLDLARGEALRYLAEIVWTPQAIMENQELDGRELDERTVEVATHVAGKRASVRLVFAETGEITRTVAERPRLDADGALTRWVGEYRDYELLNGVTIPRRVEVRWELPDGPYTYWRGTITSFEVTA